jgi:ABC-type multidrug transport system fused ATPase/permease subunit
MDVLKPLRAFEQVTSPAKELLRKHRWPLLASLLLMCVNRVAALALPVATKFFLDKVVMAKTLTYLPPLAAFVVVAGLVQGVCSFSLTQLLTKTGQRIVSGLREKVWAHMLRLPIGFYDKHKSGELTARVMDDAESIRNLFGAAMIEFVGAALTSLFSLALLLRLSPGLMGIAFSLLFGYFLVAQHAMRKIQPFFSEQQEIRAEIAGRVTETLGGMRVVKGYMAEDHEYSVFASGSQRLLGSYFKPLATIALLNGSSAVITSVIAAVIMALGTLKIRAGVMTIGDLATFIVLLALLVSPLFQIAGLGSQLAQAFAALRRTQSMLLIPQETIKSDRSVRLGRLRGSVVFDRVSFEYESGRTVLHDISFRSEPGSVTALVGSSGAGKSTVISLIAGFHQPTTGSITVDGVELGAVSLDSYRSQLGIVLQDVFLFDGSIWENVSFSRPGAHKNAVLEACRLARVDQFAESFPDGYQTIVGERGVRLSGGQKQRISIARAILANPRILILDEATSSLDSESEIYIQKSLKLLMQDRTTFVIAHRLSTVRRADRILVLDNGRIRESGTHETLLASRSHYYNFYINQHFDEFFSTKAEDQPLSAAPAAFTD